jgi:hypothetical protein
MSKGSENGFCRSIPTPCYAAWRTNKKADFPGKSAFLCLGSPLLEVPLQDAADVLHVPGVAVGMMGDLIYSRLYVFSCLFW